MSALDQFAGKESPVFIEAISASQAAISSAVIRFGRETKWLSSRSPPAIGRTGAATSSRGDVTYAQRMPPPLESIRLRTVATCPCAYSHAARHGSTRRTRPARTAAPPRRAQKALCRASALPKAGAGRRLKKPAACVVKLAFRPRRHRSKARCAAHPLGRPPSPRDMLRLALHRLGFRR